MLLMLLTVVQILQINALQVFGKCIQSKQMFLGTVVGIKIKHKRDHQDTLHGLFQVFLPILCHPPSKIVRRSPGVFYFIGTYCPGLLLVVVVVVLLLFLPPPPTTATQQTSNIRTSCLVFVHVQVHPNMAVHIFLKTQEKQQ